MLPGSTIEKRYVVRAASHVQIHGCQVVARRDHHTSNDWQGLLKSQNAFIPSEHATQQALWWLNEYFERYRLKYFNPFSQGTHVATWQSVIERRFPSIYLEHDPSLRIWTWSELVNLWQRIGATPREAEVTTLARPRSDIPRVKCPGEAA